jgi:hypothetical protein
MLFSRVRAWLTIGTRRMRELQPAEPGTNARPSCMNKPSEIDRRISPETAPFSMAYSCTKKE